MSRSLQTSSGGNPEDRGKNNSPIPIRDSPTKAGDGNGIPAEYRNYSFCGPKDRGKNNSPIPIRDSPTNAGDGNGIPAEYRNYSFCGPKDYAKLRLQGILENRPQLGPQTVHFDIANGCNVRCTTCWHHSPHLDADHIPSMDWKRRSMSFAIYRDIMDDLLALGGLEQVILSGMGDPSLNDELADMVHYAHANGVGVTIITNLLAVDLPAILASPGELNLLVSVCGVTSTVWDAFHGGSFAGGFEKLLDQLSLLRIAKFLPKHVQVINGQNYHQVPEMVRFATEWPTKRVNFKFASLIHGTEAVSLSLDQKVELVEDLIPRAKAIAQFKGIVTDLDAFATQVSLESTRTSPIEDVGCYMGTIYCRITVDCELLYCCNTNISVGFIDERTSFRALWEGSKYAELRAKLGNGDYFDSCQQCGKYKQNYKWSKKLHQLGVHVTEGTPQ